MRRQGLQSGGLIVKGGEGVRRGSGAAGAPLPGVGGDVVVRVMVKAGVRRGG